MITKPMLQDESMETIKKIIETLPYAKPYYFVDRIVSINENEVISCYRFKKDEFFYPGHFKNNPVIPGLILLEAAGQMGAVCLGIYLLGLHHSGHPFVPVIARIEADFQNSVYPGEEICTYTKKLVFRKNVLKCELNVFNQREEPVLSAIALCKFILNEKQ